MPTAAVDVKEEKRPAREDWRVRVGRERREKMRERLLAAVLNCYASKKQHEAPSIEDVIKGGRLKGHVLPSLSLAGRGGQCSWAGDSGRNCEEHGVTADGVGDASTASRDRDTVVPPPERYRRKVGGLWGKNRFPVARHHVAQSTATTLDERA